MGVSDLNDLITRVTDGTCISSNDIDANTLVIDGSNMIVAVLSITLKTLKQDNLIATWDGINKRLLFQIKYMVTKTMEALVRSLNTFIKHYGLNEIYFVTDPRGTVSYTLDSRTITTIDDRYFAMLKPVDGVARINAKEGEQAKRRIAQHSPSKQAAIDTIISNIENDDNFKDLTMDIVNIYSQTTWFNEFRNMASITKMVLSSLYEYSVELGFENNCDLYIVESIDEADLVIKNLVEQQLEVDPEHDILVASRDTDYNILFCDSYRVVISDLAAYSSKLVRPYDVFRELLNNADVEYEDTIFDTIIRLAPLLGNDYTVKSKIMSASSESIYDEIHDVFVSPDNMDYSNRKKVYRFCYKMRKQYDNSNYDYICSLDKRVHDFDREYFIMYFKSVIIYKNWYVFNKYTIMNGESTYQDIVTNYIHTLCDNNVMYDFVWNIDASKFVSTISIPDDDDTDYVTIFNDIDLNEQISETTDLDDYNMD